MPPFTGLDRTFVYTDGAPDPTRNIFSDWATLHAAAADVDDATILFDPTTVGGTLVIPVNGGAGTPWVFTGARVRFVGNLCALSFAVGSAMLVEIEAPIVGVCEFVGLAIFRNLTRRSGLPLGFPILDLDVADGPVVVVRDGARLEGDNDPLGVPPFVRFFGVGGIGSVFLAGGSLEQDPAALGGATAVRNDGTAVQIRAFDGAEIGELALASFGGSTTVIISDTGTNIAQSFPNLAGTVQRRVEGNPRRIGEIGLTRIPGPTGDGESLPQSTLITTPVIPVPRPSPIPSVPIPLSRVGLRVLGGLTRTEVRNASVIVGLPPTDAIMQDDGNEEVWNGPVFLRVAWHLTLSLADIVPDGPSGPSFAAYRHVRIVPQVSLGGGASVTELQDAEAIARLPPAAAIVRAENPPEPGFYTATVASKVNVSGTAYFRLDTAEVAGGLPGSRWSLRMLARGDSNEYTEGVPPFRQSDVPPVSFFLWAGSVVVDSVQPTPFAGGENG